MITLDKFSLTLSICGFLLAASLYQGKLVFQVVNIMVGCLFADLVIADIHFNFQLFYQWLTEVDFSVWH